MNYNGPISPPLSGSTYSPHQRQTPPEPMDYSPKDPPSPIQTSKFYQPQDLNARPFHYPMINAEQNNPPIYNTPPNIVNFYSPATATDFLTNSTLSSAAMQYGTKMGKDLVDKEIGRFVVPSKLKYYFSVDTSYVLRKLKLLIFPYTNLEWSQKYENNEPLPPRHDVNAPDLYIPSMAYITYVLIASLVLGIQDRFTPEMLGIIASQALAWVIVEIAVMLLALYIMNIPTRLKTWDVVSFAGYKFVGTILCALLGLVLGKLGYFIGLIYFGLSLSFFMLRVMKFMMMVDNISSYDNGYSQPSANNFFNSGNKRRHYFLLIISSLQPFLMWWLSYHLEPIA